MKSDSKTPAPSSALTAPMNAITSDGLRRFAVKCDEAGATRYAEAYRLLATRLDELGPKLNQLTVEDLGVLAGAESGVPLEETKNKKCQKCGLFPHDDMHDILYCVCSDAELEEAEKLRAALKAIRDVACGEDQVSDDDTEALAWVYQRATTALGAKR